MAGKKRQSGGARPGAGRPQLTERASSDEMVYHLQNASRKDEDYRGCEMAGALILACANINWNFNK